MSSWTKKQINQHKQAAKALNKIIEEVIEYIKNNLSVTDVEIRKFIAGRYKKYHLKSDKEKSIVALASDTANVHYYAEQPRQLKLSDLIMIDVWARLDQAGAPFADITWMLYYGRKLLPEHALVFRLIAQARDRTIKYLQNNLKKKIAPLGKEVDAVARNYLARHGWDKYFLHSTGHSLGFISPHGNRTRISRKGRRSLPLNVGYTIEPGIYFKNKFGVRSEIDFYIAENYKLIITTKVQKKIIKF
ncbi:MAG: aminopeptidase P family protein [Parcubacteria group bacterium]|nr:aminopeptidase P family protein [Parcubacteria group bacterium]